MNILQARFKNVYRPQPPKIKAGRGFLSYGDHNDFPQNLKDAILSSPTAISCYSTLQSFIFGSVDETNETLSTEVSESTTLLELHDLASSSLAMFDGVAFLVRYNQFNRISAVDVLEFENVRINQLDDSGKPTHFVYNPNFGRKGYRKNKNVIYPTFNPDPNVVASESEEYDGQILYIFKPSSGVSFYPYPSQTASSKDMVAESLLSQYHISELENGFFISFILQLYGDPNETIMVGDTEMTRQEQVDLMLSKDFQGSRNAGRAFVTWAEGEEARASILPFPANEVDNLASFVRDTSRDNILTAYKIPPSLASIATAGRLGDTQEIINAFALVNSRADKYRTILESAYLRLFSESDIDIDGAITIGPLAFITQEQQGENGDDQANQ